MAVGRVKQAVILAGGQGTRLRPLTDDRPKPMVLVNGTPFIDRLMAQLAKAGIEDVVVLTGYEGEVLAAHIGDGSRWGLRASAIHAPEEDETGTRIRKAIPALQERFLLLYSDNYCPISIPNLVAFHEAHGKSATVTVYANRDKRSKDNMLRGAGGEILVYDKSRARSGLNCLDIGYFVLDRSAVLEIPIENVSLERAMFPTWIERDALMGFWTEHRYASLGELSRIGETERYFSDRKVVLLDRDGVINKKAPKARYVTRWEEFEFLPGALETLASLTKEGCELYVISNQAGIARGEVTAHAVEGIHRRMINEIEAAGGKVGGLYLCPHGWDEGCFCRKPSPGMLFQAAREHHFDLTRAVFVGDDPRDKQAGDTAECTTVLVDPEVGVAGAVRTPLFA